jgi:tetratricopeptide (TPR) repeat protein
LGDAHRLGRVTAYLVVHFVSAGELDRALEFGQRAMAIATTLGDIGLTVVARNYLGHAYRYRGDYHQAMECYCKNVAYLHGALLQERFGLAGLASVESYRHLATCLVECGVFAEGRVLAEEGVRIAEAADHPYSRVMAYSSVGFRALWQGDLAQAIPMLERALDLAQGVHFRLGVPRIATLLGAAYTLAGRTTEALPLLEQAVEQDVAMHFMSDVRLGVWLGEAYLRAGRLDEAGTQAQRTLEFSRAHQARGHEAYTLRLLGEIAAQREPPEAEQAEAHYQQTLALAEALGMRPLQAHCYRGLGALYRQVGRAQQARAALGTAIELYRAMEMTFWLPQTEVALAQIGKDISVTGNDPLPEGCQVSRAIL